MNDSDKKLLQGCVSTFIGLSLYAMIGVIFIYAITHW
jgi:hypothetical protein